MTKTIDWSALSDEYASDTPEIISEVTHPTWEFTGADLNPILVVAMSDEFQRGGNQ